MEAKRLIIFGIVFMVIQFLLSTHLFVTFSEMTAYAASKATVEQIFDQLNRIEQKVDKLILGY